MALHKGSLAKVVNASLLISPTNERLMTLRTRMRKTCGLAITVGPRTPNNTSNGVPIANSMVKSLDVQGVDGLGSRVSVSRSVKSLAGSVAGQDALFAHGDGHGWRHEQICSANDSG